VALTDLFDTLQTYLGSSTSNDFNLFGRVYRVMAQADTNHRHARRISARLLQRATTWGNGARSARWSTVVPGYGPDR